MRTINFNYVVSGEQPQHFTVQFMIEGRRKSFFVFENERLLIADKHQTKVFDFSAKGSFGEAATFLAKNLFDCDARQIVLENEHYKVVVRYEEDEHFPTICGWQSSVMRIDDENSHVYQSIHKAPEDAIETAISTLLMLEGWYGGKNVGAN